MGDVNERTLLRTANFVSGKTTKKTLVTTLRFEITYEL